LSFEATCSAALLAMGVVAALVALGAFERRDLVAA
jgi:hypothetical protein